MKQALIRSLLAIGLIVGSAPAFSAEIYNIQYSGFQIWINCDTKSAVRWKYTARRDTGNHKRYDNFFLSPDIPSRCQQTSVNTYKTGKGQVKYDRGHLVPANAMDSNIVSIKQTNTMTNILPQVAQMNRGSWYQTELYVECRRDREPITVVGGVYTGTMPSNGDFSISHGVIAPEAFWKVAYGSNDIIGWWITNSTEATASKVDDYIVSAQEIERRIGQKIDVPIFLKNKKPTQTNALTAGCKRS